ncbi:MAG: hypothetical protein NVS3B21_05920 [Acidimicrobiales bacterium]
MTDECDIADPCRRSHRPVRPGSDPRHHDHLACCDPDPPARVSRQRIDSCLPPPGYDLTRTTTEGKTDRQIGEVMYLADKTVKNDLSSLWSKLGMERRAEAAAFAARLSAHRHATLCTL